MRYTVQNSVSGDFDGIIDATIAALRDGVFGVLCDITVQATFEEKLSDKLESVSGA